MTIKKRAAKGKTSRKSASAPKKQPIRRSRSVRDDFSLPVLELLAAEVGYHCSNPDCCAPTIGPSKQKGISNVGVGAHITAAAPRGPRFDKSLTRAQRIAAENGIWTCHTCGGLVDNDAETYPVKLLRKWKRDAIARVQSALQSGGRDSRFRSEEDFVAAVRAGNRAERESQLALEAVTAAHRILDVLANAVGPTHRTQRELRTGNHEARGLKASFGEVTAAVAEIDRVARAISALWDSGAASACWRLTNFTHRQLNGMRNLLAMVESGRRGEPWTGPTYASQILNETRWGHMDFIMEVELLVAGVDKWADKPLHRTRKKGVRYEWPG